MSPEAVPHFIPTPENISSVLGNRTLEETEVLMKTVDGRKQLVEELMQHEEMLKERHPQFSSEALLGHMNTVADTLEQQRRYIEQMSEPEKKGMFRRAWETIKKHKVTISVVVLALAAAAGIYYSGLWEQLLARLGLGGLTEEGVSAAEATEAVAQGAGETAALATESLWPESVIKAVQSVAGAGDIVVHGDEVLYEGTVYSVKQFAELAKTIAEHGGYSADNVLKILRTNDARFLTWDAIYRELIAAGVPQDYLYMPYDLLEVPEL